MKLGVVVDGGSAFISELLADWQAHYATDVFAHRDLQLPFSQGRVNQWRLRQGLARFLQQHDVVFFEWAGPLLIQASRLNAKTRLVARLHSFELYEYAPHIRWEGVDRVILVSRAMRRRFCELYPAAAARTIVTGYGKRLAQFQPRDADFTGVLGMLCNLVPIKRVYEVILSVHELNQAGVHLSLVLGGMPGEGADAQRYYAAMQRLVKELCLQNQICFQGHISRPAEFLRGIDIFISNSYWEGQQNALIEAMATGCYCLSHFWDGADEVLPRSNLFIGEAEMREKIIAYCELTESEKRRRGHEMRALAEEKFDLRDTLPAMRQVLEGTEAQS